MQLCEYLVVAVLKTTWENRMLSNLQLWCTWGQMWTT